MALMNQMLKEHEKQVRRERLNQRTISKKRIQDFNKTAINILSDKELRKNAKQFYEFLKSSGIFRYVGHYNQHFRYCGQLDSILSDAGMIKETLHKISDNFKFKPHIGKWWSPDASYPDKSHVESECKLCFKWNENGLGYLLRDTIGYRYIRDAVEGKDYHFSFGDKIESVPESEGSIVIDGFDRTKTHLEGQIYVDLFAEVLLDKREDGLLIKNIIYKSPKIKKSFFEEEYFKKGIDEVFPEYFKNELDSPSDSLKFYLENSLKIIQYIYQDNIREIKKLT